MPENSIEPDVLISGGGPTGLATAYEALKSGKKVVLVTDRSVTDFSRVQRVFVDEENRHKLVSMLGGRDLTDLADEDRKFMNKIRYTNIGIRHIEAFLKRRIDELAKDNPGHLEIIEKAQIEKIDLSQNETHGQVTVNESKKTRVFKPQYIIGADGRNHHAANKVNKNYPEDNQPFTYTQIQGPQREENASAYVVLKTNNDSEKLILPKKQFIEDATKIGGEPYLWGITLDHPSYEESQGREVKCTFGGEIPEKLFDKLEKAKEKAIKGDGVIRDEKVIAEMTNHLKTIMTAYFKKRGIENPDFSIHLKEFKEKDSQKYKLRLQPFKCDVKEFKKADRFYFVDEKGPGKPIIALAGDSGAPGNFELGVGLNNGLKESRWLGNVFHGESIETYNKKCEKLTSYMGKAASFIKKLGDIGRWLLTSLGESRTENVREKFFSKTPYLSKRELCEDFAKNLQHLQQTFAEVKGKMREHKVKFNSVDILQPAKDMLKKGEEICRRCTNTVSQLKSPAAKKDLNKMEKTIKERIEMITEYEKLIRSMKNVSTSHDALKKEAKGNKLNLSIILKTAKHGGVDLKKEDIHYPSKMKSLKTDLTHVDFYLSKLQEQKKELQSLALQIDDIAKQVKNDSIATPLDEPVKIKRLGYRN